MVIPPSGGAMTAFALRTSAPDGRFCVVLLASDATSSKNWHEILDSKEPDRSVPLDFVARLEDTYYVRQSKAAPTYPIPVSQTRGVASCPIRQDRL